MGQPQILAIQKDHDVKFDDSTTGQVTIHFSTGTITSRRTIFLATLIIIITFHIVPNNTSFLLCLRDMDLLKMKFDNLHILLVKGHRKVLS